MEIRIQKILKKNIKQGRKNKPGKIKVKHIFYWLAKGHQPKNVKNRKELNDYTTDLPKNMVVVSVENSKVQLFIGKV